MDKVDVDEAVFATINKGIERAESLGIDVATDKLIVIQLFDDLQGIIVSVENEGGRTINLKVADNIIFLEKKEGTLDWF